MVEKNQVQQVKRDQAIELTVLICQIKSVHKDVEGNIQRIKKKLQTYSKSDNFDIIIMPEMALTGYNFETLEEIKPLLEQQEKGATFQFLQETALTLNTYVVCGYPELYLDPQTNKEKYYNSSYVIDREGKLFCNYRKTFLFETDKVWASEGDGFKSFILKNLAGVPFTAGIGICMDINPYEFLDSSKFELAEYLKEQNIDVLLFPTAWNDSSPRDDSQQSIEETHNYWLHRLWPLINTKKEPKKYNKSWALLVADRVGQEINAVRKTSKYFNEEKAIFVGCSACIQLNPYIVIQSLDKRKEDYIKAQVKLEK